MSKPLTNAELIAEISEYKRRKCRSIPTLKKELVKMCDDLNLRTTKADPKAHAAFNVPLPPHMMPKKNYTKKELIVKIAQITKNTKGFYKDWTKRALNDRWDVIKPR